MSLRLRPALLAALLAVGAGAVIAGGCRRSPETAAQDSKTGAEARPSSNDCACDRPASFSDAVQRVRPAVVNLYSTASADSETRETGSETKRGAGRARPEKGASTRSLGSGVILDEEGYLVTNHHVVRDADDIRARLLDGRWFETRTVGSDPRTDLALLQLVDPGDVPTAPLGDSSNLEVGDWVIAIGNPIGLNSTVTVGVTSGIGRNNLQLSKELNYQDFIQTDASINPGNSGGPLVDAEGRVVGLNTVVSASARGIGFAIPSAMIEKELPWLKKGGDVARSWVGLFIEPVPEGLRAQIDVGAAGGALVTGVVDGGPAEKAGLQKGDVVVEVGGTRVDGLEHLTWMAGRLEVGSPVEVAVQRGSERRTLELVPTAPPDPERGGSDE